MIYFLKRNCKYGETYVTEAIRSKNSLYSLYFFRHLNIRSFQGLKKKKILISPLEPSFSELSPFSGKTIAVDRYTAIKCSFRHSTFSIFLFHKKQKMAFFCLTVPSES